MGDTSDESDTNDVELYSYAGCYDNTSNKLLNDEPHRGNPMSAEICYKVCTGRQFRNNFNYFGTQKKDTCFCGKVVDIEAYNLIGYKRNTSECSSNCNGRDDEKCGSKFNVSLYKLKGNHGNETTTTTTNGLPTNTTNNVTLAGNHGNETTKTTNGLPTNTTNNVTLAATIPIILVTGLAFLLIAAVLVSIAVCYRRKKKRNSQSIEIQQNQIKAEINDSSVYTEVMNNDVTDVRIIKTKEDKDENKTIHLKIAVSMEQDNKYESLSTNRTSIEHIYESDSIHTNQYESLTKQEKLDKHTYASTERALPQSIKTPIEQKDEVCNKYESLSSNRNSVEHTYESDLIHANQYESLTHKQKFEEHTYASSELALHTSAESDFNQYQSLTMPPESDTHVYASTVPYSKELEMQHSFASS